MTASVHNLGGFRFLKRFASMKAKAESLAVAAKSADDTLKGINAQLAQTIESQRILNQHLSRRTRVKVPGLTVVK